MCLMVTNIKGVSSMKLHRELEATQQSAWHLAHRLREGLVSGSNPFAGPAEVDETYTGEKRRNMSNAKRKAFREAGAGRRPVGKAAVVCVRDRATRHVAAQAVESVDKAALHGFIAESGL